MDDDFQLLLVSLRAGAEAGQAILDVYHSDFAVEQKEDKTPLTLADRRAHEIITAHLAPTGIPILSEEGRNIPFPERRQWKRLWMVDPLDGTKEFVKRNGEFTVNIALIDNDAPVMGVVLVPVKSLLYFGARGLGAYVIEDQSVIDDVGTGNIRSVEEVLARATSLPRALPPRSTLKIVGSRSHLTDEVRDFVEKMREAHGEVEFTSAGSSLKICLVAAGEADIYPRLGPTMEWDIAAGQAVAENAGARFYCHETGQPMVYNRENMTNPWFIVERAGFSR
ncbi:MAG: 3'(2'),5'-bisphosphate nucleotidase CysQ [Thermodesulfobacteriota bacterium]